MRYTEKELRQLLNSLSAVAKDLNGWEKDFVGGLLNDWEGPFTPKQRMAIIKVTTNHGIPLPEEPKKPALSPTEPTGDPAIDAEDYGALEFAAVLSVADMKRALYAIKQVDKKLADELALKAGWDFDPDTAERCRKAIEAIGNQKVPYVDNDGEVECDGKEAAAVSPNDEGGVYVQCWAYVRPEHYHN
jgi:hypothetical protein